jgi:hypothetical protein
MATDFLDLVAAPENGELGIENSNNSSLAKYDSIPTHFLRFV